MRKSLKTNQYFGLALTSRVAYVILFLINNIIQMKTPFKDTNCNYDCFWYRDLAENGYSSDYGTSGYRVVTNWNFFPLFPAISSIINKISPMSTPINMYMINSLFFIFGTHLLGNFLRKRFSASTTLIIVAFICISPINIYFMSGYSESLFYFLIAASLYLIDTERMKLGILALSLLGITRNTGILIASLIVLGFIFANKIQTNLQSLYFILAIIPFIFHLGYLKLHTGNFFSYIHAAEFYGVHRANPIDWISQTIQGSSFLQLIYLALYVYSITITIHFFRSKYYLEALIVVPVIITSTVYPYSTNWRYYLVLYPLYLIPAAILKRSNKFIKILAGIFMIAVLFIAQASWIAEKGYMV